MKTTPFTAYHIANGARMGEFAGYNMPIEFKGINTEHLAVRHQAGLFDVSHMGEFLIEGPGVTDFVQHLTTNDITLLHDGKVQYSFLPNGHGGIVDDVLIYRFAPESYMMVVNASNIEKDWRHLTEIGEKFGLQAGRELTDISDQTALLALQGPLAMKIMQELCTIPVDSLLYYTFTRCEVAGIADVLLSITGYTGSGGCELYVPVEHADKLWHAVVEAGASYGMQHIGLGARDTLRLEMGFCLYGNDIDDNTSPVEAGMGWVMKFVPGNDFVSRPSIEYLKRNGIQRQLTGFEMTELGIPRHGYSLVSAEGTPIGTVTSGTMSPMLKKGIGMGYVNINYTTPGTEIAVMIRNKPVKAKVVKMPFVNKSR